MTLTLEQALRQVPGWLQAPSLRTTKLQAGQTNLNYRVDIGPQTYALRIAGENTKPLGIDRPHEHAAAQAAARIDIAPQVIHSDPANGILVTRFIPAPTLPPLREHETIQRIAQALRQVHTLPPTPVQFSPFRKAQQWLDAALHHGAALPQGYDRIQTRMLEIETTLPPDTQPRFCHNDPVRPNLFDHDHRILLIDWEYAGTGDPLFDLAVVVMNNRLDPHQEHQLLQAYHAPHPIPPQATQRLQTLKLAYDHHLIPWYLLHAALRPDRKASYTAGMQHHLTRLTANLGAG